MAYCIGVLLFTFALRGTLGFGGALGLPLLALALPVKLLAPAWSLIGIASSAAIIGKDRHAVDRKAVIGLLPGCFAGIALGLFVFASLDAKLLGRALGVFVILYAGYSWWSSQRPKDAPPPVPPRVIRPVAAVMSGVVGTMFGSMASIFFSLYLDAGGASKHVLRATISAMLLVLSVVRVFGYAAVGELDANAWILFAAAPFMGIGLLVGDKIHVALSERAFKLLVCSALALCGVALLVS
jgi:uncharacterized protein